MVLASEKSVRKVCGAMKQEERQQLKIDEAELEGKSDKVLEDAGRELTDEALERVAGGVPLFDVYDVD
jgi:hypothetical protein